MRHTRPLLLLPLLLLAACSDGNDLEKLQTAKPSGDDYSSALAAEYMAYAESEKEQGHRFKGEYFAEKGTKALDGNPVDPEDVDSSLPAPDQRKLKTARASLVALQTGEMKHVTPRRLARAQLLFDCWQNQLATRQNTEKVPCDEEFSSVLLELQKVADGYVAGEQTTHMVAFGKDSAVLGSDAQRVISQVVEKAQGFEHYTLQLDGHLEALREHSADAALAVHRMEALRAALVSRGVPDENIEILRAEPRSASMPVTLSVDKPRSPRSVDINLRTYSVSEQEE